MLNRLDLRTCIYGSLSVLICMLGIYIIKKNFSSSKKLIKKILEKERIVPIELKEIIVSIKLKKIF